MEINERKDIVYGKNAVRETLRSERPIDYALVARGEEKRSLAHLIAMCREKGVIVKEADVKKLDFTCGNANHQGIILFAAAHEYSTLEDIFVRSEEKQEPLFVIVCDCIEDPHNLGAIIRTAEAAGAHGLIIPQRRSATLSGIVSKTSSGALEYIPVARVANLNRTLEELKERGAWIYAADMDGQPYEQVDFSGPAVLVIGSEGKGVSRLVRENADVIVSIPMKGEINSLNASVAGGILMFEIAKKR